MRITFARESSPPPALLWLGVAGVAFGGVMFWIMAQGPGVNADSAIYIEIAANIVAGQGFYAAGLPWTHYPPAYPLLLAGASLPGTSLLHTGRIVHAVLFGVNAMFFAWAIHVATERSRLATMAGLTLFLSSTTILTIHSYMWSEPLFLTCALGGFLLLGACIARPRTSVLVASSLLIGVAIATRYVGVALLVPLLAGLFLAPNRDRRDRLRDLGLALVLACTPVGLFMIRNIVTGGSATNRTLAVHTLDLVDIKTLVVSLHDSVFDIAAPGWFKAADLALWSALFAVACWRYFRARVRRSNAQSTATQSAAAAPAAAAAAAAPSTAALSVAAPSVATVMTVLALSCAPAYIVSLVLARSFLDATIPLDARLISPAVILAAPGVFAVVRHAFSTIEHRAIWWSGVTVFLVAGAVNAAGALSWMRETHRSGQGYASTAWRGSDAIAFVRSLDDGVAIYSNDQFVIQFLTGRRALMIPFDVLPLTQRPNPDYERELEAMCRACTKQGAILVWLDRDDRWFRHTRARFESICTPLVRRTLADGVVYAGRAADPGARPADR